MSYWTAIDLSRPSPRYGEVIWSEGPYEILHWRKSDRLYLHRNKFQLAELISGMKGYQKKFKGDPHRWIAKVREKDELKIRNVREQAETALKEAQQLEDFWKD